MKRKTFLAALIGAAAAAAVHLPAQAQSAVDFPNKPVTLFTAFAPGSGPDATLRLVADKLGRLWNQRVTVENRPGGGGFIAMEAARRTAADGYTLLQLDSDHLGAVPHLYKQRGAAAVGAFEPVASIFRTTFLVAVGTDSKWKTMSDLLAAARAEPGKVSYGSWGVGSPGHLGAELLEELTGIRMQHVPFREVSQLFPAVGSGDVAWSLGTLPSSSGAYKAGKLRYIAVASTKRLPQLPEVPTAQEAGAPVGFDVNAFVVLVAPKGLPAPVRAKINADMARVLADPEIKARFDTFAFEPISWSPEEIARAAEAKSRVYEGLVKKANISLE
ncbi:Bug family tripartite tricarboxylate transporter substrate binding protein [Sphaerotilus natans]|uniref:Bug family tripartite tricarboxylate transporter substrate binding protein n=1 Tax=Sphaerotilus natans TaxID=34103 RepID=UPI00406C36DE